jgi:hypothetical protein
MTPIEKLLERLPDAKPSGEGWSARCPAHEDRRPSLSFSEGADGRALLKCHSGCETEAVCEAIGLRLADLMPPTDRRGMNNVNVNGSRQKPKKQSKPLTDKGQLFASADDAVKELERSRGTRTAMWTYHNAAGEPVGIILRWTLPESKKEIRPVSLMADGWRLLGMPEPRPLYRLPDLASANRVYVCEGEKAADAVRSLGLVATTSVHGCESPGKTDWGPLAGKEVIILPDNDKAGRDYAKAVAGLLSELSPTPTIKFVELPDLPEKGDAADFVAARAGADKAGLRQAMETLASDAEPFISVSSKPAPRFLPFPVDVLPKPIRDMILAGAKSIGCDTSYLALPILTVAAAAIGFTHAIQLKRCWTPSAILWTVVVGESGTAKTPPFKLALRPIDERQKRLLQRYDEANLRYESELAQYDKYMTAWRKDEKSRDLPPVKPVRPQPERCLVKDITVEALAPILKANPRGVLLARDELAGWFGSFDRYAGGSKGADAAQWLSMHNGQSITVDRKTSNLGPIDVPGAAVCICGGIQPAILNRALGSQHRENGLAGRFLMTCPPRRPKSWTDADIDPSIEAAYSELIERLFELQPEYDDEGEQRPKVIRCAPEALGAFIDYYNAHNQEQADLDGDLSFAWSKLEEYAARLALIIHLARWAAADSTLANPDLVDLVSMQAGIKLATWFKHETRRVYNLLSETDEDRDLRKLYDWIAGRGGRVTERDVQMGCRWLRQPGAAEQAMGELIKAGWASWEPTMQGQRGRPTRQLRLNPVNSNHSLPCKNDVYVDADTDDCSESHGGEWGEV